MSVNVSTANGPSTASRALSPWRVDWLALSAFGLLWLLIVARMRIEWSINPQYGYGWTVPFLAAFVFWRRLQTAPSPAGRRTTWLPTFLLLSAALLLIPVRLVQESNPDWRVLSWTMALCGVAISFAGLYLAGGLRWTRHFAFPVLFFLVAVPWPTKFEQFVIQGLMRAVALINVEVLNAIGISAVQMGNVIEVSSGFVGIDEACTGVRSLQATFMLSLFFGEFYSFTPLRRVLLMIAGALLAFGSNLVRTFLLVYIAEQRGTEAIKSWHDPAGMTILMVCLFGLWGISMLMGGGRAASPAAPLTGLSGAFRLSRFVLALLLAFVAAAEAGTQIWYRIHEARAAKVEPWSIAWPTAARDYNEVPIAKQAEDLLRYNEGGGGSWIDAAGHQWTMFFFKWLPGRTAGLFIKNHRPDICLPASGMTLRGGVQHKRFTVNGVTLPIRAYVFEAGSTLLHVYYCYWDGTPIEVGAQDQENWTAAGRLEAARRGKRDVGTQMLEVVVAGYHDEAEAERAVRRQLSEIVRAD